jgi:predicted  nucleic acid-binding Zn-ribbon protein
MDFKTFLFSIILFFTNNIFAQTDSLTFQKEIKKLNNKVILLQSNIEKLQKSIDKQITQIEFENLKSQFDSIKAVNSETIKEINLLKNARDILGNKYHSLNKSFEIYKNNTETKIDSLKKTINSNTANIKETAEELKVKIEDIHLFANKGITDLTKKLSRNTFYWITAILIVALFVLLIFILLIKQIFKQKTDLYGDLQKTRKSLEEESVKIDNKLIEILETQLKIISSNNNKTSQEVDHSLALKVADEIVRLEKNIARLDSTIKGIKPLIKGVERIKDNFTANGYEMVPLLGKEYDDRMNLDVINFIDDDSLPHGKRIITRIIKPQVNYNGVLIQRAQVDVSQN